jgi:hypothetical protein
MSLALLLDLAWYALIYMLVPTTLGALAALPFWMKRRVLLGNALGSAVIAVVMIFFILRVFAQSFSAIALDPGGMFPTLAGLVFVGWIDVLILFFLSGAVENRVKKRIVNPDDF